MNERLRHAATLLSLVLCLAYGTGARATPPPLSPDQRAVYQQVIEASRKTESRRIGLRPSLSMVPATST